MKSMKTTVELAQFGSRLGTRLEGIEARRLLTEALDALPEDGQLVVSLHGIRVLSGSFADEAVAKTIQLLTSGLHGERTLVLSAPEVAVTEDLSDKLGQRRLAALCRLDTDNSWRLLGQVAAPLAETLFLLVDLKSATAREIAERLGIPPNVSHNRIRRLVSLRLVREERIDVSAPNTQYRFHSIVD
jgi:Arc/MetJ family transcription regulator